MFHQISPHDRTIRETNYGNIRLLEPIVYEGVKAMSHGFVAAKFAAGTATSNISNEFSNHAASTAVMRGPMVSNVVSQLIRYTNWGELDYLIVDLPPGTGDIHLTLAQQVLFY